MTIMEPLFIKKVLIHWDPISRDSYLKNISSLQNVKEIILEKPFTFFSGENGMRKSTLLEAIAVAFGFNPEGGKIYRYQPSVHEAPSAVPW